MTTGKRGLTQETILETAIELIDQYGFESLTLAGLAKQLNIQPPSLYNHVKGLEGVKEALANHGLRELYKELADATIGRAGEEAVLELARAYLKFSRKHPGLYECIMKAPTEGAVELNSAAEDLVKLIQKVLQFYKLDETSAIHAIRSLRSLIHGFASLERIGGFGIPVSINESLEFALRTFLIGLEKRI